MKRSLRIFLLLALMLTLAFVFAACGHKHEYEKDVVAPTCTEGGYTLFSCSCGDKYKGDETPALGHDTESHEAKAATCTEGGWGAYMTCKREGCAYSSKVGVSALGHVLIPVSAKPATCTEDGWNAHEVCDRPGCNHTTKIVAPKLNHDLVNHPAQAPTCTEGGWDAYVTCKRTGCSHSTKVDLPALNHDLESHGAQAPTCTEGGWDAYVTCKRTGCSHSTKVDLPALNHDLESHGAQAATCTEGGWDAYVTCKRTGCNHSTKVDLPALNHDYEVVGFEWYGVASADAKLVCKHDASHTELRYSIVTFVTIPAGCTTDEAYVYTASYDHLGTEYTDTQTITKEGSATGCIWTFAGFEWAEDYSSATAKLVCSNDSTHTSTMEATVYANDYAADCYRNAYTEYRAVIVLDNRVISEDKIKTYEDTVLGHKWKVVEWSWNGYTQVELFLECEHNDLHMDTTLATVTSEITTAPTCETEGVLTYTATVTYDGVTYTDSKTETLAKAHSMEDGTCTVCGYHESQGFVFEEYGDGWQIKGLGTCTDVDIVIPTAHEGKPVLLLYDLLDWAAGERDYGVKSITVPAGITVRYDAFNALNQLESLTLDSTYAYYGSKYNNYYTFISAFFGASSYDRQGYVPTTLKKIVVTGTDPVHSNCFYDCAHVTEIHILNSSRVNGSALNKCTSIEKLTLPRYYHTDASHYLGSYFQGIDPNNYYTCPSTLRLLSIRGGEYINAYVSYYFACVTDFIFASTHVSISVETNETDRIFYEGTAEQWAATKVYSCVQGTVYFYSETAPTAEGNFWHYAEDGLTPVIWTAE